MEKTIYCDNFAELTKQLEKVKSSNDFNFYVETVAYDTDFNPTKWYFVGQDKKRNVKLVSFEYDSPIVSNAIKKEVEKVLSR